MHANNHSVPPHTAPPTSHSCAQVRQLCFYALRDPQQAQGPVHEVAGANAAAAIADAWRRSNDISSSSSSDTGGVGQQPEGRQQEGQGQGQLAAPLQEGGDKREQGQQHTAPQQGTREVRLMLRPGGRCWHATLTGRLLHSYQQQLLAGGHDPDTARLQVV